MLFIVKLFYAIKIMRQMKDPLRCMSLVTVGVFCSQFNTYIHVIMIELKWCCYKE